MKCSDPLAGAVKFPVVLLIALATLALGWWLGSRPRGPAESAHSTPAAASAQKQLWTCGMHPQVIQDHPGLCPICHMDLTPLDPGAEGQGVKLDPVVVQNMGLRVAPVLAQVLERSVRAYGTATEPEPLHRDVTLRVGGTIVALHAATDGMPVREGDPLFDLFSPELSAAVEELIGARRATVSSPSSPMVRALRDAARRKLELLGLLPAQIDGLEELDRAPAAISYLAPVTGHVTERRVNVGSTVMPGELLLRIASNARMWIDARVFERDLVGIRTGLAGRVRFDAIPGRVFDATVAFVHPHLDMETRTALVRLELDNADGPLRQGMYATVEIALDMSAIGVAFVVPREAVIDTGLRRVVFVALGEGRFEARDVEVGSRADGGLVQIRSGVASGDMVVVSGQFLLDAESRIREAVRRHLDAGLPGHEPRPDSAPGAKPVVERASEREAPQGKLDAVFSAYLAIAERLGTVDETALRFDVAPLARAAHELAAEARGETKSLATRLAESADGIAKLEGEARRKAFGPLSEAAIALADRAPPSAVVAPSLFVVHCPMAPGSWLQTHEEVENPYYATAMKACGEVVRAVPAAKDE
ncbi:MAG: efflux RND transporter periplasmic adaptor subunit [Planctomycetota bacterium]|nr:efflux RND transporter periplasmic adaptor subunit [Planctomycetota bacterium]